MSKVRIFFDVEVIIPMNHYYSLKLYSCKQITISDYVLASSSIVITIILTASFASKELHFVVEEPLFRPLIFLYLY